jgi:hypothetical protein
MSIIRIALLFTLCALALPATAQVYRWVDKDGKVHYASQKPPDVQAEALAIKSAVSLEGNTAATPSTAAPAAAAPTAAPPTGAYDSDAAAAAMKAEVDALNKQRCSAAKSISSRYDSAPFLEKSNADGTKSRLTPEEEAAERARMKGQVTSACAVSGGG